uniref:Aminotran_1_2 domain-containing protein n=2 Tax=Meloidogyne hapla TaxID=6305 RepID=A0A1I8BAM6_MELHA
MINSNNNNESVYEDLELLDLRNEENNIDINLEMIRNKFSDPTFLSGLEQFLCNYSIPNGNQIVRKSISHHLRRLFGVSLNWEELLLVNNELAALEVFVNKFCLNGDLILCPAPFAYPELAKNIKTRTQIEFWPIHLTTNGIQLEINDLIKTYQKIEEKGRRARALLLHNPHPILGSLQDGDRRISKLVEWTSEKEMFILIDESLASLDLWEFSSCLALDHNSLQSGKNIIWMWNGSKHFSLPGLEFSVIYYPQSDIFLNSNISIAHHQCSPLVQFFASKLLDDFEWSSELFSKRKSRLEKLSSQMLNELKNINIYSNQILKTERPITQWILIDLFKFLSLINGNISFNSEKELYKEFKQIGKIELISGEELGMERPGWFRLRYLPNVIERLKNVLEQKLSLNKIKTEMDITELGSKYGGIDLFPKNENEQIEEKEERKIWSISEGDENEEELKEKEINEELEINKEENYEELKNKNIEEDEVLSKVFSIFPEKHWEKPLNINKNKLTKSTINKNKLKEEQKIEENNLNKNKNKEKTINNLKIFQQNPSKDLSFIEELVKSSKREEEEIIKWKTFEEEFYEEAFTEEDFEKISKQTKEELLISPNKLLNYSPLSITVPDRPNINYWEKERSNSITKNILDESNDSKRIIEIIDKIFRDAVQIKDFSSSSTESHPNNAINQHDRHWSDSGLAAESPPDFSSLSPPPPQNKEEKPSTVGIQLPFENNLELSPEYSRRPLLGPTPQMLDDSGIFVELQPGTLSIDFPLLVPIDKINKQILEEISESEITTNLQLNNNIPIMTIDLPFKSEKEEEIGWIPLENLKEEIENKKLLKPSINEEKRKLSATDWYKRFGDDEEEEEINEKENKNNFLEPINLAALINEGAEFCPIIKKEQKEEEENEYNKSKSEVLDWKPLEQINILIEDNKEDEINEDFNKNYLNDNQQNNLFESIESNSCSSTNKIILNEEEDNSLIEDKPFISSRKSTKSEALDIVSEWNNKLINKKLEKDFDEKQEEEMTNLDVRLEGNTWQENSKVLILPLTKLEKAEFYINNLPKSKVEQLKVGENLKTIIHLNSPPKKPPRKSLDSEPEHSNFQNEEKEKKKILFSNNSKQIHHKMQMRKCRRRHLSGSNLNRNNIIVEHINITQLEYLGGDMLERIEKRERIITNISTKLNNFAPNELFNKLNLKRNKNERINKFVEIKRNRSEETVLHTPGTNWCISSIYKTTKYGWEKQTLKPRFTTKFDEMQRRTST